MKAILKKLEAEVNTALKDNEVPVGCVIVHNNKIVSFNHNQRIKMSDPLAHAEILCIKDAARKLKTWNLSNCELYVTLKPCKMCQEVIKESRIKKVYYLIDTNKIVKDNVEYIELKKIDEYGDFKDKIVNFFKDKR